jgi:hypothetical protein
MQKAVLHVLGPALTKVYFHERISTLAVGRCMEEAEERGY